MQPTTNFVILDYFRTSFSVVHYRASSFSEILYISGLNFSVTILFHNRSYLYNLWQMFKYARTFLNISNHLLALTVKDESFMCFFSEILQLY